MATHTSEPPASEDRVVRVFVVDDHPVYREGLAVLLSSIEGFKVVGSASGGDEAIALIPGATPDVVVMDIHMTGMSGIEATKHIAQHHPEIGVLVLTMSDDDGTVILAMRAGARGYLLKGSTPQDISRAIRAVANGDAVLGPAIATRAGEIFGRSASDAAAAPFSDLTERERQILEYLSMGFTNANIAHRLHLAPKTVRNNITQIFVKIGATSRVEALLIAREHGFGANRDSVIENR